MLEALPRPAIIAHRGASKFAPENTLSAFHLAVQQGVDAIELDAKLSHDRHVVVIHDGTVNRTTDGLGRVVDLTLAQLKQLDAGSKFGDQFHGEQIPTLLEVLQAVGQDIFINIELANYTTPFDNLPDKTADLVELFDLTNRVLFSSFNPWALIRVCRRLPRTEIGLLSYSGVAGLWARSWLGSFVHHQALHVHHQDVKPSLIARAHRNRLRLHAYTVNEREEMRRLLQLGIDGIITDDPPLAVRILGEASRTRSTHA